MNGGSCISDWTEDDEGTEGGTLPGEGIPEDDQGQVAPPGETLPEEGGGEDNAGGEDIGGGGEDTAGGEDIGGGGEDNAGGNEDAQGGNEDAQGTITRRRRQTRPNQEVQCVCPVGYTGQFCGDSEYF